MSYSLFCSTKRSITLNEHVQNARKRSKIEILEDSHDHSSPAYLSAQQSLLPARVMKYIFYSYFICGNK